MVRRRASDTLSRVRRVTSFSVLLKFNFKYLPNISDIFKFVKAAAFSNLSEGVRQGDVLTISLFY